MTAHLVQALGGVGMFLLGMLLMTEGLRGLAGDSLRRLLARFTTTPASGAAAGALTTAVIQSSSATTVTAVGFVGAGLMAFPQALGIIFGANIGTTLTGWIVAVGGYKLDLGTIALPLLFVGVMARLFGRQRLREGGLALAGFGLLFVGIGVMQSGLSLFEGLVTPTDFPPDTLAGRFTLLMIGVAITVVTQSSSAGVATALVALHAGAISFPQAAAMVIGMDVGTTITGAMATIGGSVAMRQTGIAHVLYNVLTGLMAFLLLGPYAALVAGWIAAGGPGNAQIALVGFHTLFNTIGVLAILPVARPFARLIVWLIPDRDRPLTRHLDRRLRRDPDAATDTATATLHDISHDLFGLLAERLSGRLDGSAGRARLARITQALAEARLFLDGVTAIPDSPALRRKTAALHALDHLFRLSQRCAQENRLAVLGTDARLQRLSGLLRRSLPASEDDLSLDAAEHRLDRLRQLLRRQRRTFRARTLAAAGASRLEADRALERLDGVRWLHRSAYHVWRIVHHSRLSAALVLPPDGMEADGTLEEDED